MKDILWIEDHLDFGKRFKEYKDRVERLHNFSDFFDIIENGKIFNYNIIILDVDLQDWPKFKESKFEEKIEKHIIIAYDYITDYNENHTKKIKIENIAGVYLYLYLIMIGYPKELIIFMTGNESYEEGILEKHKMAKCDRLHIVDSKLSASGNTETDDEEDESNKEYRCDELLDIHLKKNEYYKIRYTVYSALEYWRKNLPDEDMKISINKVYNLNDSAYKKVQFTEAFDTIKMLLPVKEPCKPGENYYLVLQALAQFNENRCNISNLKGHKIFEFHNLMRQFRNLSEHKKLQDPLELDSNQFIVLFFTMLRVLFDSKQCEKKEFSSEFFHYETDYGVTDNDLKLEDADAQKFEEEFYRAIEGAKRDYQKYGEGKANYNYKRDNFLTVMILFDSDIGCIDYKQLFLLCLDSEEYYKRPGDHNKNVTFDRTKNKIHIYLEKELSAREYTITLKPDKFTSQSLNERLHFLQKYIIKYCI